MSNTRCCAVPGCVSIATTGDQCAVHATYRRQPYKVKCSLCGVSIQAGTWHKATDAGIACSPKCKPKKPAAKPHTDTRGEARR